MTFKCDGRNERCQVEFLLEATRKKSKREDEQQPTGVCFFIVVIEAVEGIN